MRKEHLQTMCKIFVILLIVGIIAFYVYDVVKNQTPYNENLFRTLAVVFLLLGTLVRLRTGGRRQSLDIYEKAYEKELGYAFRDTPLLRKKLLCACRLYNESNYRKALKYLFQLLKDAKCERDIKPVLLFIALCYTDAGVPQEAIKVYHDLLRYDPNNAQAHSNLGFLYLGEGQFAEALQHYNKAIEHQPNHYSAYVNRANYYFRIEEYDAAIEDAKKALEIKNNGAEAAGLLTIIYALKNDEENRKKYFHIAIASGKSPEDLKAAIDYYRSVQEDDEEIGDAQPEEELQ